MPKKLRKKELDDLKQELMERRSKVSQHFAHANVEAVETAEYRENQDVFSKNDETAEGISEMLAGSAITESYEKNLKDIEQALALMEKGDYGICKYCKDEIPIERLKARPASTSCINCKTKFTN